MPKKKKAEPFFTKEQAESLVQGEEHRVLVRNAKPGLNEEDRKALIAEVEKAISFEAGLEVIADAL